MTDAPKQTPEAGPRCEDCGAQVPQGEQNCQTLFDEVLAREFGDYRYARLHRLTVDVYSLQHPERYMRSGKSSAAHLTGTYAALEGGVVDSINHKVQQWLNGAKAFDTPDPPSPRQRGELTITRVFGARDPDEHLRRVREWADCTWAAWKPHHELARQWIDRAKAGNRA
jgi:hypothetical protein